MKKTLSIMMMCFLVSGALFAQDLEKSSKILRSTKDQNGKPTFVQFKKDDTYSLQNSRQIFQDVLTTDSRIDFRLLQSTNDKIGIRHEKFQQYFNGIKVEFATYTLHGQNGKLQSMSGEFYDVKEVKAPTLTKEQGLNRAMQHIGASSYLWEDEAASKELGYKKPEGELVLLPMFDVPENAKSEDKIKLAYKYEIFTIVPIGGADVYVDAHTGKVLFYNQRVKHYDNFGFDGRKNKISKTAPFIGPLPLETIEENMFVSGNAATRYSGSQAIETTNEGPNYSLNDASRKVYTRNANNSAPVGNSLPYITNYTEFTDNDNNWTSAEYDNNNKDNAALDAHWGAMKTYDYWSQVHGRDSYDNNGAQLRSYVHVDNNYDNAFWYLNVMSYGDGSSNGNEGNGYFDALTSIDVAGHEIGHAITEYTANLAYQRESGGMNEGFSDIWGAAIEHFAKGNGNDAAPSAEIWLIGDEIDRRSGSAALRSMSDPKSLGQPDTYGGTYWQNPNCGTPTDNNDYCGVHTNSGVLNHWFYLLTAGGSGTNDVSDSYNVSGIGMSKASAITYRLLSVYLSANSTYANARTYGIQAAVDLYGAGSAEEIATTNAFYAVGIGSEYVQTCALGAPSGLASSNIADNSFTVSWNSVAGAVSYNVTVAGATNTVTGTSYNATGLIAGTQYTVSVAANCNVGGSGASSNINVTTTGTAPITYCDSQSSNINDEYIGRVQLNTIDNASGGQFYTDFTSISTNLTKNSQYTITVTPTWTGTVYNEGYAVWIDYNQDGDFTDSGEQVMSKSASKTTPVSGSFTVPSGASNGNTRMRVSMSYNATPTPCQSFTYGEVEDYTITIGAGTPDTTKPVITLVGPSPVNVNVGDTYNDQGATATDNVDGDITSNIVTVNPVDTNTAGTYIVTYNVSDAAGNAADEVTRTVNVNTVEDTTPPVITLIGASTINLTVGDAYNEPGATATDNVDGDISANIVITGTVNTAVAGTYSKHYNVSDAAGNAANQVTRSVNVSEPSSGCSGGISSFPYTEGFENTLGAWTQSSADDLDWTVDANGTPSSNTGPSSASQGNYYIYVEASSPNYPSKRAILNSPCFDLSGMTAPTFDFDYHMYGASDMGTIDLEASTDDGGSWTSIWNESGNKGNSWQSASIDLSAYAGGTVQLRFNRFVGSTWQADIAIDNISVSEPVAPTCDDGIQNGDETGVDCGGTYCVPCSTSDVVLHQGYFETGWDGWSDGGSDAARYSGSRSYEGNYSIRLRDNTNSSTMTLSNIDVSPYAQVDVEFYFYAWSMENGEDFWLQYYNGSSYTTVAAYARGTSFENGSFYVATVTLDAANYNFVSNARFRFRCDASGNSDYIYIDQVTITGRNSGGSLNGITHLGGGPQNLVGPQTSEDFDDFKIYPNPVSGNILNVKLVDDSAVSYRIVNMIGQKVLSGELKNHQINVESLKSGLYFVEINDGEETMIKKFIRQ
jgi:Zn-dependent metalloprotease